MLLIYGLCFALISAAQKNVISHKIERMEPPNWWIGMQHSQVQIIFYGPGISALEATTDSRNAKILDIHKTSNPNYVFVNIDISEVKKEEIVHFNFKSKGKTVATQDFPILQRRPSASRGLEGNETMYLAFPDRFCNGNPKNDEVAELSEKKINRKALKGRHGGDLQGVMQQLPYLKELGITALWLNPILENDQPDESYHGYAATHLYKVDERIGSNELFKQLADSCHARNIKVVWDVVYNHWGNRHWMFKDIPDSNWFHWYPEFTRTTYRAEVLMDPYASNYDKSLMSNAWFDKHMPDLNQQDPWLARYLIENSLWWIEYAGIDAFRIDTYAYPDQQFMVNLDEEIRREYPEFFLFGETWVQGSPIQAWFVENSPTTKTFNSALNSVTDFQLYFAITKGLNEAFGWEEGFRRIELTLAHDILYRDPSRLVTFLDNHDLSRFFSMVGEDSAKFSMGLALLYTLRGIPCLYYGTEIGMKNFSNPDALVREDFPGGWQGDARNAFLEKDRTEREKSFFNLCAKLGAYREQNHWFGSSKLLQFVPENNTYVYFRYDDEHRVMCLYNLNDTVVNIEMARFNEKLQPTDSAIDIITGETITIGNFISIPPKAFRIIELNATSAEKEKQ
jgi:glycosidase